MNSFLQFHAFWANPSATMSMQIPELSKQFSHSQSQSASTAHRMLLGGRLLCVRWLRWAAPQVVRRHLLLGKLLLLLLHVLLEVAEHLLGISRWPRAASHAHARRRQHNATTLLMLLVLGHAAGRMCAAAAADPERGVLHP